MRSREKVVELLKQYPDGLESKEIIEKLGITISALYTAVYMTNKKDSCFRITNFNLRYKLKSKNKNHIVNTNSLQKTSNNLLKPDLFKPDLLKPELLKKLKLMQSSDVNDVLDMLKKSYFYKKSAEALVEANEFANIIRTNL